MITLRLNKMHLRNFKGIRELTLDTFGGADINVYGDNATGKTTVFDGFVWLLFDKDSQNKKDFQIKTLQQDGNVINNLEHEVEAEFDMDGKYLTLKKVFTEKWTKKRGTVTAEFSGHTTDYSVDGVPVSKKEYDAKIGDITDEEIFKLLTSPTFFNEQLDWKKRREILLGICGDMTDAEVIASDKALARLPELLCDRSIEDHRKVIAAKRTEINKELDKIPVRIDEITRSMPELSDMGIKDLAKDIEDCQKKIQAKHARISDIENGSEAALLKNELINIDGQLQSIIQEYRKKADGLVDDKRKQYSDFKSELFSIEEKVNSLQRRLNSIDSQIAEKQPQIEASRNEWHKINDKVFEFSQVDTCPTCNQAIPVEKLEATKAQALANFNQKKAESLEGINKAGKALAAEVTSLNEMKAAVTEEVKQAMQDFNVGQKRLNQLKADADEILSKLGKAEDSTEYQQLLDKKTKIVSNAAQLAASTHDAVAIEREGIEQMNAALKTLQKTSAEIDAKKASEERIIELKAQEKALAKEYEQLEGELFLTEQFIKTKVSLLEERINGKFEFARFKLFDTQINGGIVECCETTYNGVPYGTGLNNAARINVGLDIINTLSEHFTFNAPIFVDNREAVTKLIDSKSQVISLIVSEQDKQLRVEMVNKVILKETI